MQIYRTKPKMFWLLVVLTLIAAFLRFHNLGVESYWKDEGILAYINSAGMESIIKEVSLSRPPMYVFLSYLWSQLFGHSDTTSRILPALLGILSVPLLYRVGTLFFNREIGIISAIFLTFSGYHVYWSQTHRYYTLQAVFALLAGYFYFRALKTEKPGHLLFYALLAILVVYTHTLGIAMVAALGFYFLVRWKSHRGIRGYWLLSQMTILVAITPHIITWLAQSISLGRGGMTDSVDASAPYDWWATIRPLLEFLFLDAYRVGKEEIVLSVGLLILGTVLVIYVIDRQRWPASASKVPADIRQLWSNHRSGVMLTICWSLVTVLVFAVFSWFFTPLYNTRYMIAALPALCLLVAFLVYAVRKAIPIIVFTSVILLWQIAALYPYYVDTVTIDWRSAANYIQDRADPSDAMAMTPEDVNFGYSNTLFWYYKNERPSCPFNLRDSSSATIESQLIHCIQTSQGARVWLVVPVWSVDNVDERMDSLITQMPHLNLLEQAAFYDLHVYLFSLAE